MYNSSIFHDKKNQENYKNDAITHNKLDLNSSLYLAYRDVPEILKAHLFDPLKKGAYRVLDYGCGAGLSTSIIKKMIEDAGYDAQIYGVDISEDNIKQAKERLPDAKLSTISLNQSLAHLGEFDLIICNFVLVELKEKEINHVLKDIHSLLTSSGITIVTNCTRKAYKKSNQWYTLNNDFIENLAIASDDQIPPEDSPIKFQVFASHNSSISFTFFDFFHSGAAYRSQYKSVGLDLLATHKPLGKESDGLQWKSEKEFSPYKIHVLSKTQPEPKAILEKSQPLEQSMK